jgi:hypothetical protein
MATRQRCCLALARCLFVCLLAAAGCKGQRPGVASSSRSSGSPGAGQTSQSEESMARFPGFSVDVPLSGKAKKRLTAGKETLVVAAYFSGAATPDTPKKFVTETGEIDLGKRTVEVAPGARATFGEIELRPEALAQSLNREPLLLVNVYSGRKSSDDNLLDCAIFEGPLKSVENKTIPIACRLIGE